MNRITKTMVAAVLAGFVCSPACLAGGPAQSVSIKIGYFNLAQVKAAFPDYAALLTLEQNAKELLRRDVEKANIELAEMQKQNKPKEEVEKKSKDLQTEISAKQQAMGQLLTTNSIDANRAVAQAVAAVAKDRGLDFIVDAGGVYFSGGEKIVSSGEDVTDAILKRLVPGSKPLASGH